MKLTPSPNYKERLKEQPMNQPFVSSGWNLSEGSVPFTPLSDDDVIQIVNRALSSCKKHTTTYKYAFFKSLLDNIFNVDLETSFLSYQSIAFRFAEIYWNLVLKFRLKQMIASKAVSMSSVERTLFDFCDKYGFDYKNKDSIFPFESLRGDLQIEIAKSIKTNIVQKYVLGAFWSDTDGQFYSFNKKDSGIYFNADALSAFIKYKSAFEKLNYYEWIKYLEKANLEEDSYALANKLDSSTERQNLSKYRTTLEAFGQEKCFYCGKTLVKGEGIPVDHFIPWSFIKDDKLWNFVLACPACNSKKSNILPEQSFMTAIKVRNEKLIHFDSATVREDFTSYSYVKLAQMFQSAIFNGFSAHWAP